MNSTATIAALLFLSASPAAPPAVPSEALPEAMEAHPSSAPPPRWLVQALATWDGPWVLRPSLYDYRYITW